MKNMLLTATITGVIIAGVIIYLAKTNPSLGRLININDTPDTY